MHLVFAPSEALLSLITQNWKKSLSFHDCLPIGVNNFECLLINLHTLNYRPRHILAQVTFWPQTFRPRTFRPKTHFGPAHFGQRHILAKDPLSIVNHSRLSMITFIFSRLATLQGLEGLKCLFSFEMGLWPKCAGPKQCVFGRNVRGRNVSLAEMCGAEMSGAEMFWAEMSGAEMWVGPKCVSAILIAK